MIAYTIYIGLSFPDQGKTLITLIHMPNLMGTGTFHAERLDYYCCFFACAKSRYR